MKRHHMEGKRVFITGDPPPPPPPHTHTQISTMSKAHQNIWTLNMNDVNFRSQLTFRNSVKVNFNLIMENLYRNE